MSGSKMMVSDEERRWVVVGIAMNKVVAPVLRDTIKQGMDTHYNTLDTHCNGLPVPCILKTLTYHQASTDGTLRILKFGNINNNSQLRGNNKKLYDYSVSSSVDLARLYLPEYLAEFSAFNESMDMSAILRLLGFSRPAPIFLSPSPALSIQSAADDVRDGVRNKWGHCDISDWTAAFFNDCFTKLEALVRSVGLTGGTEKDTLDQLRYWNTKGCQLCMGHAVDQTLLSFVQQDVRKLMQYLRLNSEKERKLLAGQKRKYSEIQQAVASLEDQQTSTAISAKKEQDKREKENDVILQRLVSLENGFHEDIMSRTQQLEEVRAQTDGKVQQLKEDIISLQTKPASHVEDFEVENCRSKLADHYRRTARVPTNVWSSMRHVDIYKIYTPLSWVREDHTTTGSSQTKLNDYTDVFQEAGNGVVPKRILVQGQTGIGKSTFVKKLAVDWTELHHGGATDEGKEALRKFELVLVIRLRDVSHCRNLTELISRSHILSGDDPTLTSGLLNFLTNTKNQEKVLFVLDGYDEFIGESDSVIRKIFQRDVLRDCCVLVTSRPSKADELREFADVHAEITGFSKEDIEDFMTRMLGKEDADNLWLCLIERNLRDLASVPLLLLFYCTLWKNGHRKRFPENRTELHSSIVECLLEYSKGKHTAVKSSNVEDNKEILAEIGKVALEALLKDDLVFEFEKLSGAIWCDESRISGLLQVTEYSEHVRPAGKVSFIHKSIQEFLAAWYITYRCIPEGHLGPVKGVVHTFERCLVLENVLQFICGLSDDGAEKVFEHLKSVRISDRTLDVLRNISLPGSRQDACCITTYKEERFNRFVFELFREAHSRQKLLKHCFDCAGGAVVLSELVTECLVEVKDLTRVINSGIFILPKGLVLLDMFPDCLNVALSMIESPEGLKLGDLLAKFWKVKCEWCWFRSFLWLRDNQIRFYITDLRVCCDKHGLIISQIPVGPVQCSHSPAFGSTTESSTNGKEVAWCSSFPQINKLEKFSEPPSCLEFVRYFECCGRLSCQTMKGLGATVGRSRHLRRIQVNGDDSICDFLERVQNVSCCLEVREITLSSAGAVKLASLLPRFENIPTIDLCLRDCSGESLSTLVDDIRHTTLKKLTLWNIDLNPESSVALNRFLSEMPLMEELSLIGKDITLSNGEMELLFGRRTTNLSLKTLEFSRFGVGSSIAQVSESLRYFPDLQGLYLHKLEIDKDDTSIFIEGLRHTPNLECLSLSCTQLGNGVRSVMRLITNLPRLRLLNLDNTGCSEEDVKYLEGAVKIQPHVSLEHLNLSCNPLGQGVRSVMSLLPNLPKLRLLNLDNTNCSEEDVMMETLPELNLEELNLSRNPLDNGTRSFTSLIPSLPKLRRLHLNETGCSDGDVRDIKEAMRNLLKVSVRVRRRTDSAPGDWLRGGVVISI